MKKKIVSISMVVALLACILAGTLAYFTDKDEAKNTFTVGDLSIALNEQPVVAKTENGVTTWEVLSTTDSNRVQDNTYENIYPGATLPKDPIVWNIKDKTTFAKWNTDRNAVEADTPYDVSEYPAYVCVGVTLSDYSVFKTAADAGRIDSDLSKIFVGHSETDWTLAAAPVVNTSTDTVTYYYYYNSIVAPGEKTSALFNSVVIPAGLNNSDIAALGDDFTMDINAFAVQVGALEGAAATFKDAIDSGNFDGTALEQFKTTEASADDGDDVDDVDEVDDKDENEPAEQVEEIIEEKVEPEPEEVVEELVEETGAEEAVEEIAEEAEEFIP